MSIRGWEDWRFHWPGRLSRRISASPIGRCWVSPWRWHGKEGRAVAVWLEPPADMGRPVWRDVLEHVQMGADERAEYLANAGA